MDEIFTVDAVGLRKGGELISSFYPKPVEKRIVRNRSGKEVRREYVISIISEGKELQPYTFRSLQNIDYFKYWNECCDAELTASNKKDIHAFLQKKVKLLEYKEYYEIDKLGLLNSNPLLYAYGRNLVIAKGGVIPICADDLPDMKVYMGISEAELIAYSKRLFFLEPGVTDVLFCARLVCIIRPLLKKLNYPTDFIIVILGPSGSFKTTYAVLYFVENAGQLLSFRTCNSKIVQRHLEQYSGHAVVVDDYHPSATKYAKDRQKDILDMFARTVGSGEGAIGVMTGEFIEGCFSLQDRMIPVHVHKKDSEDRSFSSELKHLQDESYKLNALMYLFADKVYSKLDDTMEILKGMLSTMDGEISRYRICRNINVLAIAMKLFQVLFPSTDEERIDKQISNTLRNIMDTQKKHMQVVERLEYSPDWTNEVYLMFDSAGSNKRYEFPEELTHKWFVMKNNNLYITEVMLERQMQKFLGCHIDIEKVIKHLEKTQVLEEDNSQARTKKLGRKRYYVINRNALALYHAYKEKVIDYYIY